MCLEQPVPVAELLPELLKEVEAMEREKRDLVVSARRLRVMAGMQAVLSEQYRPFDNAAVLRDLSRWPGAAALDR